MAPFSLPLVSVVLCTYNGEKYIARQLHSILMQTYTRLEVIVCDDASSDNTAAILQQHAANDSRIKIFLNEKNLGYNKNFEKACLLAQGEVIAISDQDDVWELNKIDVMLKAWPSGCDFVYSLSEDFSGEEPLQKEKKLRTRLYEGSDPHKLYFETPIHGHACMFKCSLLPPALPFPPQVFYDWWLSVVASSVGKVGCVPLLLTHHRVHPANASRHLVRIQEKHERLEQLRQQRMEFVSAFLQKSFVRDDVRSFSENYLQLLRGKKDSDFSFGLFLFFWTNRRITFYYKKNRSFLSLLKNSFKKAKTGI